MTGCLPHLPLAALEVGGQTCVGSMTRAARGGSQETDVVFPIPCNARRLCAIRRAGRQKSSFPSCVAGDVGLNDALIMHSTGFWGDALGGLPVMLKG